MMQTYLALGDSYTIGEQVPIAESFPYQLVQMLRKEGRQVTAPEIIAKTGWTTDELMSGIKSTHFNPPYDIITLLIGVNNQYRGRSVTEFEMQFEELIQTAKLLGNHQTFYCIISIPDWGITPFAAERDQQKIANEIDAYNTACKKKSDANAIPFIDITTSQRADGKDVTFIASDGLHPSGKEYAKWAKQVFDKWHHHK